LRHSYRVSPNLFSSWHWLSACAAYRVSSICAQSWDSWGPDCWTTVQHRHIVVRMEPAAGLVACCPGVYSFSAGAKW
jgi:hypothetical protein